MLADRLRRGPVLRPDRDRGVRGRRRDPVDACAYARRRPGAVFARVALPLASGGLGAGAALAFARGIGEFGATIMFAGSLQGVTQTLSLAVYEQFDVDFDIALAIGAELVAASAALLLCRQADPRMATSTRAFPPPSLVRPLELTLERRGEDARARRAVRRREVERAPGRRGAPPPAERSHHPRTAQTWLDTTAGIDVRSGARSVGLVFQDYALFPHLSVRRNIAYGAPGRRAGRRAARAVSDLRPRRRAAAGDLGRRAAAGCARTGARARPRRAAPRRAALCARLAHAGDGARRAARSSRRARPSRRSS